MGVPACCTTAKTIVNANGAAEAEVDLLRARTDELERMREEKEREANDNTRRNWKTHSTKSARGPTMRPAARRTCARTRARRVPAPTPCRRRKTRVQMLGEQNRCTALSWWVEVGAERGRDGW